jgi:transposase-like protein
LFHSHGEFVRGKSHVNGIENFWSFAKRRLPKFNGCAADKFVLHLKECEFRYNHRGEDLFNLLSKTFNR